MTNATIADPTILHATLTPAEAEVLRHLRAVRYGHITVQVHDARIVQIERTEKIRPDPRHG
jgi:hypothetical protein